MTGEEADPRAVRVHADLRHVPLASRWYLCDIVKALTSERDTEARREVYGAFVDDYVLVGRPENADVHVLALKWNWYVEGSGAPVPEALGMAADARKDGVPFLVFAEGDLRTRFPDPSAHIFQASLHRSDRRPREHAMPPRFEDYRERYRGGAEELRTWSPRPVVGFCGQAGGSAFRSAVRRLRLMRERQRHARLGSATLSEPPRLEHTKLRTRALQTLDRSPFVETDFRLLPRYRAGIGDLPPEDPRVIEARERFIGNVLGTDYTLCVRGRGNWSKRFYETLCLGRIPALVDTDGVLPFEDEIPWSDLCVVVDVGDLDALPSRIAERHQALGPEGFADAQRACRTVWEDSVSLSGFYRTLARRLREGPPLRTAPNTDGT